MKLNRRNSGVLLICCFLVCGCGDQGEQGKDDAIERIDAFTFPDDWDRDGTLDSVCIYIIFHDKNDHTINFTDLSCTVDFRFYEALDQPDGTFEKGNFIYGDTVELRNANLVKNANCAVRIPYEELPSRIPNSGWLEITVSIEGVGSWTCFEQFTPFKL